VSGAWQASLVALWVFFLFETVLLVGALRSIGLINLRLGPDPGALITDVGLDRGVVAPDFEAIDAGSRSVVRFHDLPGVPRVVAFVTPTCMACRAALEGINELMKTRDEFDYIVVCRDHVEACAGFGEVSSLRARMLIDPSGRAEREFDVQMTPFVYVLDEHGRVLVRGVANDWRGVESLLEQEGTLQAGKRWVDTTAEDERARAEEAGTGGRSH
jgi:methylamine dehydrogenase accessory protein MauD